MSTHLRNRKTMMANFRIADIGCVHNCNRSKLKIFPRWPDF